MLPLKSRRLFLVLLFSLAASCSTKPVSRTTVDRVLKAPAAPNAPYEKFVLVGVAPSRELARELEQGVGAQLKKNGVIWHSFVQESPAKEVTQAAVDALVADTGSDAVLMITGRMTGGEVEHEQEPVDMQARTIGDSLVNFFRYEYKEYAEPSFADITLDVNLVTVLFDARTNERVHSLEASTTDGDTSYAIVMAQGKAIVARLKKDGMID